MRRWIWIGVPVLFLLAIGLVVAGFINRGIDQPIAFNHQLHIEGVGAECVDCHLGAEDGVRATIPNISVCAVCHEEPQGDSPEELRVVEYIQEGTAIPWRKIYWVPDHVYFSHRRHTEIASIDCETCHGAMAAQSEPVSHRLVELTMDSCIDCHRAEGVSNDCILCHR